MKPKLIVDTATRRVAYVAFDGIVPERVLILDGGRQQAFFSASCEVLDYAGQIPAGFHPQSCWGYRVTPAGLEPVG